MIDDNLCKIKSSIIVKLYGECCNIITKSTAVKAHHSQDIEKHRKHTKQLHHFIVLDALANKQNMQISN
jgi:hypothetical protein